MSNLTKKHIIIEEKKYHINGKKAYTIFDKDDNHILGTIAWTSVRSKWVFMPNTATSFEEVCLREIATFIKEIMKEEKK